MTVGSDRYFAVAALQEVTITSSSITTIAHVAYMLATLQTTGALAITTSGLPNGTVASVTVTGPDGFSQPLTATQTLNDLVPGSYLIAAATVTSAGTTYGPQLTTQTVSVAAGAMAVASVLYSPQTYAALTPGYHVRSMTVVNWAGKSVIYDYKIYIPTGYAPTRQWPVIVTAHGSDERSGDGVTDHNNNNTAQLAVGLGPHIAALREQAIVVFPQMPLFDFGNARIPANIYGAYVVRIYMTALNQTLAEVNGASTRIYMTGNSQGGYELWDVLYQNPAVFAAGIPAAAAISATAMTQNLAVTDGPAAAAAVLAAMPLWLFAADDDTQVPYASPGAYQDIVNEWAGRGIGDPPFRHTLYHAIGGHQPTWDTAFASAATWTWLFAQHR